MDEARILANHAAELSGWDRYDLVIQAGRHSAFDCRDLPRGWCYVAAAGSRRMLLVHPDAAEFAMDVCCSRLRREAMEHAMGLQRLETLLIAEMDEQSLAAIPDDLSELLP